MAEKNQSAAGVTAEPVGMKPLSQQSGQARPCPKDCRLCSMAQQICCSSMLSFQMFEVMNGVITRLDLQSQRIYELEQHIAAIRSTETELSAPAPVQGDLSEE